MDCVMKKNMDLYFNFGKLAYYILFAIFSHRLLFYEYNYF